MTTSTQTAPPPGYIKPKFYKPEFDSRKFRDLMLHIAHEGKDDLHLGITKMCKIIFYCDFEHYWMHGTSITGATYTKAPRGPLPQGYRDEWDALIRDDEAKFERRRMLDVMFDRLVPQVTLPPLEDAFGRDASDIIKKILAQTREMTTREISEKSHKHPGWMVVGPGEVIPYESTLVVLEDTEL